MRNAPEFITRSRGRGPREGVTCITFLSVTLFIVMRSYLFAAAFFAGGLVYAHHSPAGTYLLDQTVVLRGTVTEFILRNPHSFLVVDAPDENGQIQQWAVEWGGGGQLAARGVVRDTFKPGDEVTIVVMPGK